MSNVAIRVEGLGKRYQIGAPQERYKTFRDSVSSALTKPVRAIRSLSQRNGHSKRSESIWALKDVSFEIKRGEVVGVIGRNGAGKSTLLKILSRITDPTEGLADIHGRIGSLLEVGTGFHPELTGRENTYLNGAILGMRRKEIDEKFDEIVAFAEIERFIDTPVKHYSSGMYLRLAFAVAAHLEPEILLVDEVLAVGDAAFQKKCLGRMSDVAKEGRTVLFVSHNMTATLNLCRTAICIESGSIRTTGKTDAVVRDYVASYQVASSNDLSQILTRSGDGRIRIVGIRVLGPNGTNQFVPSGANITFEMDYEDFRSNRAGAISVDLAVSDEFGQVVFALSNRFTGDTLESNQLCGCIVCLVPKLPLVGGRYSLTLWCAVNGSTADCIRDAYCFEVLDSDYFGTGKHPNKDKHGALLVDHSWRVSNNPTWVDNHHKDKEGNIV